jgi:lipopolysaccharide transport system ATP-binding protein
MATAIKVENLSKIYRLGEIGTGTISRDIERFVKTKILKQEDPFLKIGETNDRAVKGTSDIIYSLKDINFEIAQGDALGIIGRNGAGKSTLLKILSRVTSPTTGKINIKGRVASLLEVGTGFHPELTGRENIYLNGAILGMRKREIDLKLDEIIDFSGVERYIDTPVKRYSSGMYVRLAFAVAAHLESEILIVDEVLAVGDAEFQKKCLGKMSEVRDGEGRTVLFVSHNMSAIRTLCASILTLSNGMNLGYSNITEGINKYLLLQDANSQTLNDFLKFDYNDLIIKYFKVSISQQSKSVQIIDNGLSLTLEINYEIIQNVSGFKLFFYLLDKFDNLITQSFFNEKEANGSYLIKGKYRTEFVLPSGILIEGQYYIKIFSGIHDLKMCEPIDGLTFKIDVIETNELKRSNFPDPYRGLITLPIFTKTTKV